MNQEAFARVKKNILALFSLQLASYALPLVTMPYLVRVLGPENYGRIAFAQAIIHYFLVFTDYGFNLSATRQSSLHRNEPLILSRLFFAVMLIKLILLILGYFVLLCVLALVPGFGQGRGLYTVVYLSVVGSVIFPVWLFQGLERMRAVTACTIAAQIVATIAIFALIHQPDDYLLAATIQASTSIFAGAIALIMLRQLTSIRWMWPGWKYTWEVMADGWQVFLSTAALSLYTNTNTVILGLLINPTAVGYFAAAERLIRAVQGLLSPVSQSVYPYLARLSAQSKNLALIFIKRLLRLQGVVTLVLSIALFSLAGPLVNTVLGPEFESCEELIEWMAFLPFIIGISNVFGIQTMLNFNMKQSFSRILISSGLLNILLVLPLASRYGVQGAAMSVLVTELSVTVAMALALNNRKLLAPILGINGR